MRTVLLIALSAAVAQTAVAQSPVPTMHAEARVVQVDVVVTDSRGKPVTGLTKEDFAIRDEGKPRAIDIFSVSRGSGVESPGVHSPEPAASDVFSNKKPVASTTPEHSTVIIIDNVNTTFRDWVSARQAVTSLMSMVPRDERIALYLIAVKMGLIVIQDYTSDRDLLIRRLESYIPRGLHPDAGPASSIAAPGAAAPGPPSPNRAPLSREGDFFAAEGSRQARGSLQAMADHLGLIPGRKSVFWVTDGLDPKAIWIYDKPAWDKTIEALNDANVAVNTVDLKGPQGNRAGGIAAERTVADRTGGHSWFGTNDVDAMLAEGIENSRTVYTLAFYLPDSERDGRFHKLEVQTLRPGLELQYRQGYYAGETPLSKSVQEKRQDPESALLNPVDSSGLGITARVDMAGETINIRMSVDPDGFSLVKTAGVWKGSVEESVVEFDAGGSTLGKISDKRSIEVPAADRAHFDSQGASWPLSIPLRRGAVKISIVVRDPKSGRMGSLSVPLRTPRD